MAVVDSKDLYTFISTGDKVAMYTLRVMCLCRVQVGDSAFNEMRDYYIQNLSNDKATAEAKAAEMSGLMNLEFKGNADFELNEIRRIRDEMASEKREAAERAHQERIAEWAAERAEQIQAGVFIMGKHTGKTAAEVAVEDLGYLFWLAGEVEANGKLGICAKIAANYIQLTGVELPGYIGEVDQPIEVTATLKRVFWTQSQYPTLMHIATTVQGNEIVFFSVAQGFKEIEIGQTFTITGTVKEQREGWGGTKQTVIGKPKLPKPAKAAKVKKVV